MLEEWAGGEEEEDSENEEEEVVMKSSTTPWFSRDVESGLNIERAKERIGVGLSLF